MSAEQDFSTWLRRQLQRREWRPAELSRRAKINSGSVSRWINGEDVPSPESCLRIAEALSVDPDDVLALAGHRIPDRPLPPDDPIKELYRMMQRMKKNPDRVETLRVILERYLENDRASRDGLLSQAA